MLGFIDRHFGDRILAIAIHFPDAAGSANTKLARKANTMNFIRCLLTIYLDVFSCSIQARNASTVLFLLAINLIAPTAAKANVILVTTTQPGINSDGLCSLQEAIYSANFDNNSFVDPAHPSDPPITTGCVAGNGDDTISLPDGAVFLLNNVVSSIVDDPYNYMGLTATPIIFSKIVIEGNGARLERPNPSRDFSGTNFRAFAVGSASIVPNPGNSAVSGRGDLTIRSLYIKGFTTKGGDSATGGGGGMGAGGAICNNGTLTVENSTFENNGARGGDGGSHITSGPGGGGGGLGGNGGSARGNSLFDQTGQPVGYLGEGGGGGGGGSRGNGGINGDNDPFLEGWAVEKGGGGGGTLASGTAGWIYQSAADGKGGFRCGGNGGEYNSDGSNAACLGGGGGGGGPPASVSGFLNGDGGDGSYGGGGGGGGVHPSPTAMFDFQSRGGKGGFGGGGGAASAGRADWGDNGGGSSFGGGGGAGKDTPGEGGTFGGNGSALYGGGGAALGGALFNHGGTVIVRNSTFSGNYVLHGYAPPVISAFGGPAQNGTDAGGAIFSVGGTLTVENASLSGNESTGESASIHVYHPQTSAVVSPTRFNLYNTIIANSVPQIRTCQFHEDVMHKGAGNLIETNFGCPGMVSEDNPLLGVLQLNAPGLTPTMAMDTTSPAYNAADAGASLAYDQRGVPRPQAIAPDIGAYELIKPSAELAVSKTTVGEPYAGRYFSYIIDVENHGPTAAQSVSFTDTLPVGVTFSSITGSGGFNCTGTGPVTCTKSTMTAGEIAALTLTVFIPANGASGTRITNLVTVGSTTPDPNPVNNTASVSAQIRTEVDLNITKTGPSTPIADTDVTYNITAINLGPSDAQNVLLADTVAVGTAFVSLTAPDGWNCVKPAVGTAGPSPVTCTASAFAAGGTASFDLIVHLASSAQNGTQLCNTATLSASSHDPTASNNSGQECGTVKAMANQ